MIANRQHVLVVDDEDSLRGFMRRNLEVRGYAVTTAANGLEALAQYESNLVDIILLDVMMPNMDGLETLRRIRQQSRIPVIVLSALGEESDKVKALNIGADDYLTKPFGVNELLARVKAVMRRASWSDAPDVEGQLVQGEIVVDIERHKVTVRGEEVDLTPTEFNLLVYLMGHTNRLLTHQAILKNVWGHEYGNEAEYLRVYIGRLRQKIEEDPANPCYLKTERGLGYSFEQHGAV